MASHQPPTSRAPIRPLYALILFLAPLAVILAVTLSPQSATAEEVNPVVVAGSAPVDLSDANFDKTLSEYPAHHWLVELYAPWCGYCQHFAPQYIEVARRVHQNQEDYDNVKVARIDIEENNALAARFMATRLPSFYYITGSTVRTVELKSRSITALLQYVAEQQWKQTAPTMWLLGPFGPLARLLGFVSIFTSAIQRFGTRVTDLVP
ncbi:hypothetical protein HDU93_004952, partial [Gonapodya sp. JEL0774]